MTFVSETSQTHIILNGYQSMRIAHLGISCSEVVVEIPEVPVASEDSPAVTHDHVLQDM